MRAIATILYGIASQTLAHRVLQGRPTSATFAVFRDTAGDDDTAEFSGSALVESVNTTIAAASGLGQTDPQRLNLTSSSGIVTGRKYLVSESQRQEWIDPIEVASGFVRARHPMRGAYTTSGAFVGTTITAAVDDAWAADLGKLSDHLDPAPDYRVRWEILVNGATIVEYSFFDLVRGIVRHDVDISDLNDRVPGLHNTLPTEYKEEQGRPLIETSWRAVQAELGANQIDTDAIRDDQVIDELVVRRALVVLAEGGWKPFGWGSAGEYLVVVQRSYDRFLEQNFKVVLSRPVAAGTSGGAEKVLAQGIWSK